MSKQFKRVLGTILVLGLVVLLFSYVQRERRITPIKARLEKAQHTIDSLREWYAEVDQLHEVEVELRLQIQDSLDMLQEASLVLDKEWNKLNQKYEKAKGNLDEIDTDFERDSLLSVWYPSPGIRNIRF